MEPEEPKHTTSIFLQGLKASAQQRQQQFDPDHLSDRYEIKEVNIDPNDFILLKKPSSVRNSLSSIEGVLVKESPAVLVFWTTDRYCTLNDHQFCYHQGSSKQTPVDGTLNFDALTMEMFVNYTDNDKRVPNQFKLVPKDCKKQFIFSAKTPEQMANWVKALTKSINSSFGKNIKLTSIISYERFWKKHFFTERDFCEQAQTGDLVLFRGKKRGAILQRRFTFDEYDHIAVILKNIRKEVILFESTNGAGVGVFPWSRFIRKKWYQDQQIIVHRKLEIQRTNEFLQQIEDFVHKNLGNKYQFSFEKLFRRTSLQLNQDKKRTYFCSQLVALLYKQLGLLPKTKSSTQYWPGNFSQINKLQLISGRYGQAKLGQETIIVFQEVLLSKDYQI